MALERCTQQASLYIFAFKVALNTLFEWLSEGGNSFDLFLKFRQLNIESGYFKAEELSEFNQKLKKGLEYNPKNEEN